MARATRSKAHLSETLTTRGAEAIATGPLGALSHDELGVVFNGLADPLQPVVAVALSSTCLGLRTPLRAALEVLKERHARAAALCRKVSTAVYPCSCAVLRDVEKLDWANRGLTAHHMATLGMILRTNGLPQLQMLRLFNKSFDTAGMQALCEGLDRGPASALCVLALVSNQFDPAGAETLAAALRRGAMPKLEKLNLNSNPALGNHGVTALATALRKLPALSGLFLHNCGIGDEGVASLVANLGKDDFKALAQLNLSCNHLTNTGCATLVTAIKAGALPSLKDVSLCGQGCEAANESVRAALAARSQ